jgi:hypothetical protein
MCPLIKVMVENWPIAPVKGIMEIVVRACHF